MITGIKSFWTKFLRKAVEKNRVYKMDSTIDSYNVKLVLWDASLQCAGEMLQKNDAGWDAVVLCSDLVEPWSLQEVMNWVRIPLLLVSLPASTSLLPSPTLLCKSREAPG